MYVLYDNVGLTSMISSEGNISNPDDETDIDGDTGEEREKQLWAAVAQTTLNGGIDDSTTTVVVTAAVFRWADARVIKVDDELMMVTAGYSPAGTSLTVVRGWNNTTAASHLTGAAVRLAYDCTDLEISCRDNEQVVTGDESTWVEYCADNAGAPDENWAATLDLGDLDYDESVTFWRRVTVPAETSAQSKQDLIHDLDFRLVPLNS